MNSYQTQQGHDLFAGGGFMPSQATQVTESPGASSARKSSSTGLLPLTVKQISQATQRHPDDNSNFSIDGVEVNNVTLVGRVTNKEERVTDVSFQLDDGTGRMEVKRWVNDNAEVSEMAAVQDGTYVRVHGHLRSFQGKKNINAFSVKPVTDFNEITFHFLECIYIHLHNVKAQGGSIAPNMAGPAVKVAPTTPSSGLTHANQNSFASPVINRSGGAKAFYDRVRDIFEEPQHLALEQGVHIDEIARRLPGYTKQQISDAIVFLSNDGAIYSTIDDDHYKSTNG